MSSDKEFDETHPEGIKPPTTITCSAGRVIFEQGAPANQAFFIKEGLVEVVINEDGHQVKLAEIGAGEVVGEMGVMEREVRMATVRAVEKSTIVVMTREELEERVKSVTDPVVKALIQGLTRRLRATSAGQVKYYKNLAAFQDRMAGMMKTANGGIDQERRAEFAAEIGPLLDAVEATLEKYKKNDA